MIHVYQIYFYKNLVNLQSLLISFHKIQQNEYKLLYSIITWLFEVCFKLYFEPQRFIFFPLLGVFRETYIKLYKYII